MAAVRFSADADRPLAAAGGYTLPVWVAAAARAAVEQLRGHPFQGEQPLWLDWAQDFADQDSADENPADQPSPARGEPVAVAVEAAARLGLDRALATARCDPGDGLDLTRGVPVWVEAWWVTLDCGEGWLQLEAGEGVGVHAGGREPCLSAYARALLEVNLWPLVPPGQGLGLRVIIPGGRALAERTSNAAFGVVDGLALIGTQARVQRSAAPDQLEQARAELERRASSPDFQGDVVLVIGENGLDLAPQLGLPPALLVKTGNWIGPLLVAAAEAGVRRLLLFGYQGKLIKLAGGIFHTHHHLADGRVEVLTALAAQQGLPLEQLQALLQAPTVEEAMAQLAARDSTAADGLRASIAAAVERRSGAYLRRYGQESMLVGAVLFDRSRAICAQGPQGALLWQALQARDLG